MSVFTVRKVLHYNYTAEYIHSVLKCGNVMTWIHSRKKERLGLSQKIGLAISNRKLLPLRPFGLQGRCYSFKILYKVCTLKRRDLYFAELPDTSFTRSISNPEAVMRRRRQQKPAPPHPASSSLRLPRSVAGPQDVPAAAGGDSRRGRDDFGGGGGGGQGILGERSV